MHAMERCISAIRSWMFNNILLLNDDKTELILVGSKQQLAKANDSSCSINGGKVDVTPVPVVKDLSAWLDSRLDMSTHIMKLCFATFFHLYNLRRIRKFLSKKHTESLIYAFISSRLDYCNSYLYD